MKCRICKHKNELAPNRKICKKCLGDRSRRWRFKNLKRHQRSMKAWWSKATPEKRREYSIRNNYDFTEVEIQFILAWKKGKCLMCGKKLHKFGTGINDACVEHDHKTGKLRGIACGECNRMLGYARDSVSILRRAIAYLKGEFPLFIAA